MKRFMILVIAIAVLAQAALAHVGAHPSVHDTVAGVIERLKHSMPVESLGALTLEQVEGALTANEKHILATEYLSFEVNAAIDLYVVRDMRLNKEPYWFAQEGFAQTELRMKVDERAYDVWKKSFDAGHVGLGVNSLTGTGDNYFVVIKPRDAAATVELKNIYPGTHTVGALANGAQVYADRDDLLAAEVPKELDGAFLLRGDNSRRKEGQLVNIFRITPHPASAKPDHVVLTWSGDPKTTQAIQWRTSTAVTKGKVQYIRKADFNRIDTKKPNLVDAETRLLSNPTLVNDTSINRHTAMLTNLEPDTTYLYSVGDGSEDGWTELCEFTTAPEKVMPFSFVYMGDAQNGLDRWGSLIHTAYRERPDAAFYIMAGDLVNRGAERDDWDTFFQNSKGVFDRRQLVPCLGNHEYQNNNPSLYLDQFALPVNGPAAVGPERAYSFEYSNALFVVLDSNQLPETQVEWLDQQLANSKAVWKFVVYHHPAYSSSPKRDNPGVRRVWGAIFDKYHVDMALQGHDHAYLRTYPMKGEQRVGTPAEGTVYVISVSGMKFYDQGDLDYIEHGMTNVATYQVLDIFIDGNRLVYRAYDVDGNKRDELVIEK